MQNTQKNACNLKKFQYNKGENPNRTSTDIFWKEGELMYKKRFLRLVSAVLALCMMAALLPTAAFAADPLSPGTTFSYEHKGKTLKYTVNADGNGTTVSVAAQGVDAISGDVVIPETFEHDEKTYTVTSIGEHAFYECPELTSIEIPEGVKTIGEGAFGHCSSLTKVTIPSSVTSIGNDAFYCCESLTSVEIPSSVTSIGEWAFRRCYSLTSIKIPSSVTTIGGGAFSHCSLLASIEISSGVTSIGDEAFSYCRSLASITIPFSVTSIGYAAFYQCENLKNVIFDGNSQLTSIGEDAFYGCKLLKSIEIPNSVTSIGSNAFYDCGSLTDVTFEGNSQLTRIKDWVFLDCKNMTDFAIPANVSTIGQGAFQGCESLTKITIPSEVKSIGNKIFYGCITLSSVTFEENSKLTSIPDEMFCNCSALTSITLPSGITSIGQWAFCKSGLKGLEIPDGVTTISDRAFMYCDALQTVTIPASVTSVASNIFNSCTKAIKITYGGSQEQWNNFNVELPEGSTVTCTGHTVQFDPNGHGTAPKNVYVKNGETIDCPTLSETGYNLDGWYYTENGGEKEFKFGESGTKVTSSMTLKAKWSPIPYQLTVNSEDRGFHDCDAEVTVDEPTKTGYTFAGWTVETKNVTPKKGDDGKWSFRMPAGNVTLTAKWEINRYTVKFMNGEDEVKSITADYNSTIAVNDAPAAPVKEGYVFGGWYSGSEKFVFGETKVTRDLTLTAKWTKGSYTLTVDGSAEGHDYNEEVTVDEPTKEGYTFAGWMVETKNVTPQKGDDGKWSFQMPAGNVTLTAEWEINEYTVVFVTAHDNTPNALTVKHGETISGDRVLKADGYEFGGWYNGTEKFVFGENGTKVTGNLTLTARWTEVKKPEPKPDPEPVAYEIVVDNGTAYLDDGATAIHTAEEGQTVILKVNPEALTEGFAFDKWEIVSGDVKLADETASETTFEMPASDVELKATVKSIEPAAEPLTGLEQAALLTTGTVVAGAGVAAVGFAAYGIGVELYAQALLPAGAALPTNCGELAVLVWNMAGKPQPALPAEGLTDAQTALLWAAESGLLPAQAGETPEDPEHPVSARDVMRALRKARSLAPKQ